jgi:SAM-dependent methyltransferase
LEGHPLSNGYDVVACNYCGFVYADTAVTQADYDRFYAQHSKYEDPKTATGGVENAFDWKRQQETAAQIAAFVSDPEASILDVGCANGGLLKALQELGHRRLCGLDPSPVCVENTRNLAIEAHIGSLFAPFKMHAYDCLILSHVLEHVSDMKAAARWMAAILKDNAFLYIEVPDASRYAEFVDSPYQDFNTEHINHFSMPSLINFMNVSGFTPAQCGQKVIAASATKLYPAIYCFAHKTQSKSTIMKDYMLPMRIEMYIRRSAVILRAMESRIQKALDQSTQLIIWGTGQLTMKLLVETSLRKAEIIAFVDSNPINQGKSLRGIRVIAPSEIYQYAEPILISTTLHQESIVNQIKSMGISNSLILLQEG